MQKAKSLARSDAARDRIALDAAKRQAMAESGLTDLKSFSLLEGDKKLPPIMMLDAGNAPITGLHFCHPLAQCLSLGPHRRQRRLMRRPHDR